MHATLATKRLAGAAAPTRADRDAVRREHGPRRLDDAARAGWLYYVSGDTQDEIARKLNVSRQTAQRLVSLSVSEGLIKVRLDHRIGRCMELGDLMCAAFGLDHVEIVPSDPAGQGTTLGLAQAMAGEIERRLAAPEPTVLAIGTGRTLQAGAEQLTPLEAPQHRIVSLTGNIAPDGSASYYNVIFSMADRVRARFFPLPLPVIASSAEERRQLQAQPMVRETLSLAAEARAGFVGVGHLGPDAPLMLDGFLSATELKALRKAGAVGEIVGWVFDADGALIEGDINARVASAALPSPDTCELVAVAAGETKIDALLGMLRGKLVRGLITDEATAQTLIARAERHRSNHSAGRR